MSDVADRSVLDAFHVNLGVEGSHDYAAAGLFQTMLVRFKDGKPLIGGYTEEERMECMKREDVNSFMELFLFGIQLNTDVFEQEARWSDRIDLEVRMEELVHERCNIHL